MLCAWLFSGCKIAQSVYRAGGTNVFQKSERVTKRVHLQTPLQVWKLSRRQHYNFRRLSHLHFRLRKLIDSNNISNFSFDSTEPEVRNVLHGALLRYTCTKSSYIYNPPTQPLHHPAASIRWSDISRFSGYKATSAGNISLSRGGEPTERRAHWVSLFRCLNYEWIHFTLMELLFSDDLHQ